jgi:hypothetical protein
MRLQIDGPHGPKSFFHQVFSSQKKIGEVFTFGVFLFKILFLWPQSERTTFFSTPDGVCFLGILFQGSGVELRLWPGSFLIESLYIFKVPKGARCHGHNWRQ